MEAPDAHWLRFWNEEEAAHYYYCPQSGATEWLLPAGAAWTDGEDDAAAANTFGMSRTQNRQPQRQARHRPKSRSPLRQASHPRVLVPPILLCVLL